MRCPVLFSHAWGEAPQGGREGEVARPLGLSRRMAETWCTNHCKALFFRFLCTKFQAIFDARSVGTWCTNHRNDMLPL